MNKMSPEERQVVADLKVGSSPYTDTTHYLIPEDALSKWTSTDNNKEIFLHVTRQDIDHLFFSFTQAMTSLGALQLCVRALTLEDKEGAEVSFAKSQELRSMAETNFRKFFAGLLSRFE